MTDTNATESMAKTKKTVYTTVTMDDGRIVEFPGERRLMKESTVSPDGFTVTTRFDFVHGESRTFTIEANAALFAKFAAHGIEQKIGDEVAGLKDPEDMVLAVDEIMDRLNGGAWSATREASGMAGTSTLAKALIESSGKTPQAVKDFLKGKTNAEKLALRNNPKIKPIIEKLEANKKRKPKSAVDTDALLGELAD
jgi:hypothetical protein